MSFTIRVRGTGMTLRWLVFLSVGPAQLPDVITTRTSLACALLQHTPHNLVMVKPSEDTHFLCQGIDICNVSTMDHLHRALLSAGFKRSYAIGRRSEGVTVHSGQEIMIV